MHGTIGTPAFSPVAWASFISPRHDDAYIPAHLDIRRLPRSALDAISSTTAPSAHAVDNYEGYASQHNFHNGRFGVVGGTDSLPASLSPSSLSSLPTSSSSSSASLTSTSSSSSSLFELTEMIRDFWSTFPCPPPWRPRLLAEVNATSRLEPSVGRQVHSFLAGKCRLQHVFTSADFHPDGGLDLRGRGNGDVTGGGFFIDLPGSGDVMGGALNPDQALSPHAERSSWCDSGCKVALGCAVLLAMLMVLVGIIVYLTRNRRTSKMAAARPSRQQLQMSTSVSDTVNCAEFPNLEFAHQVSTDDETRNPFRFRGLPHPPQSLCLPVTFDPHHPKWPHSNCSTFQPMIRMGRPGGEHYPYAYSAVYETIDDEDDDDENNKNGGENSENRPMIMSSDSYPRDITSSFQPMSKLPCGCSPFHHLTVNHDPASNQGFFAPRVPSSINENEQSLDLLSGLATKSVGQAGEQCSCNADVVIRNQQAEAETEFNGTDVNKSCAPQCAPSLQRSVESCRNGLQRLNDLAGKNRSKQDIEKSSDYCSDVSCVSVGSVSSSRNGAVGSPSSLSGYTNDFSFTSGIRHYDSSLASSQTGTTGSKQDQRSETPSCNAEDCCKPGKLMISTPSAFHPIQCFSLGNNALNSRSNDRSIPLKTKSEIANENSLLLKVQALGKDPHSHSHDGPISPHLPVSNDIFAQTSEEKTQSMNALQNPSNSINCQQYNSCHSQHYPRQQNDLASHLLQYYQHRNCHHPNHNQPQDYASCHKLQPTSFASDSSCSTNCPTSALSCECDTMDAAHTRQMAPCSVTHLDLDLDQQATDVSGDVLRAHEHPAQYSNTDAFRPCASTNMNVYTDFILTYPNSQIEHEPQAPQLHSKTGEFNDNITLPLSPPTLCANKNQFPVSCKISPNDLTPKLNSISAVDDVMHDSSLNVPSSAKKAAIALHSQYFEKSSPA